MMCWFKTPIYFAKNIPHPKEWQLLQTMNFIAERFKTEHHICTGWSKNKYQWSYLEFCRVTEDCHIKVLATSKGCRVGGFFLAPASRPCEGIAANHTFSHSSINTQTNFICWVSSLARLEFHDEAENGKTLVILNLSLALLRTVVFRSISIRKPFYSVVLKMLKFCNDFK